MLFAGISSEKITLTPSAGGTVNSGLNRRRSFAFAKQKVITYSMDSIAACVLQNEHNSSCMQHTFVVFLSLAISLALRKCFQLAL